MNEFKEKLVSRNMYLLRERIHQEKVNKNIIIGKVRQLLQNKL
jgi:hypothetical protein